MTTAELLNPSKDWSIGSGGTLQSLTATIVELGHATDTTLSRKSAGVLQIEDNEIYAESGTDVAITYGGTGASDASTARSNLGLAIGSDIQAHHASLASIAGLTTEADKMIYTTAANQYAVAALTSAARNLLDDTSVTEQKTTLGLENVTNESKSTMSVSYTHLTLPTKA